MKRYLLIHPQHGVFLGHALGLGFWSKEETGGQMSACTFPSPEVAHQFASTWNTQFDGLTTIPVEADEKNGEHFYASMAACIKAGADGWLTEDTETVGGMQ